MKFTVYTPTFNRIATLPRVYGSLKNQTYKDFIWLIIDDGSTDNTSQLVGNWIKEGIIEIEYIKKFNGGKTSALKVIYELSKTKYIVGIDSDDELTTNALAVFNNEWKRIEEEKQEEIIGSIRALSIDENNKLICGYGNYHFPEDIATYDAYWQEFVLKDGNNNECLVSENLTKIKECCALENKYWLSDKVNTINDFNLAARLGRKYKSHLINQVLRVVHYDGGNSLLRMKDLTKLHYNSVVSSFFFLNENLDYFSWNKKYFINELLRFSISTIAVKISIKEVLSNITDKRFKRLFILFYPISFTLNRYYKLLHKNYWF